MERPAGPRHSVHLVPGLRDVGTAGALGNGNAYAFPVHYQTNSYLFHSITPPFRALNFLRAPHDGWFDQGVKAAELGTCTLHPSSSRKQAAHLPNNC